MSLINTRIQNIRSNSRLDKNELRPSQYGGLNLFMQQSEDPAGILTDELKTKAENSIGSVLETPVIDYDGGVTIGNTRSVTIADDENTSQMFTITFTTYSWGFTQVPVLFKNNEIGAQKDFEKKFLKYLYKFGATVDSAALAALSAAKSQVFTDTLNYSVVGNVLQSPWGQRENIIGDLNPIFAANDHFDEINVVGNAGVESLVRKLAQKSLYNSENKTLEYSDKIMHFSSRIANGATEFANAYVVNGGSVGMLTRFDREALAGTKMADGTEWGIDTLPVLNFPIGTYYYESKGDFNAIAGAASADMTAVRKEHFGFSVDVAFVTPYNSDPTSIANPIMKVAFLKETAADGFKVLVTNEDADPIPTKEQP